jgi:hypothetical protein
MDWTVNGLTMPPLLIALIQSGRWRHPGDDKLLQVIPFLQGPVDFLDIASMRSESSGHLANHPDSSRLFREVRGNDPKSGHPLGLPWRDVEKSFFIAVNRVHGDDLGIALDYRTDPSDPCVIASEWLWGESTRGVFWREVRPTFSEFVRALGLS